MSLRKIVVSAMFLLMVQLLSAGEVWKIVSLNWEPYSGEDLPGQGAAIEKLRRLLEKEGIDLEVVFMPWRRAREIALSGEYLGYFPAWPEEVDEGFISSGSIYSSQIGILKRAGTEIQFESLEELFEEYRVGVVESYIYPDVITEKIEEHSVQVRTSLNERHLLRNLSMGKIDVGITDPKVMLFLASIYGIENVESAKVLMDIDLVLAIFDSSENRKKLEILNRILKESNNL